MEKNNRMAAIVSRGLRGPSSSGRRSRAHPTRPICDPGLPRPLGRADAFVEAAAEALVQLEHETTAIKTERFGPTGG